MKRISIDKFNPSICLIRMDPDDSLYVIGLIVPDLKKYAVVIRREARDKKVIFKNFVYLLVDSLSTSGKVAMSVLQARDFSEGYGIKPHIALAKTDKLIAKKCETTHPTNVFTNGIYELNRVILFPGEDCYKSENETEGWILPNYVFKLPK